MAFMAERDTVCPSCGSRDDDWIDPVTGLRVDERLEAYERTCYGCRELDRARRERMTSEDSAGVTFYLGPIRPVSEWEADMERGPRPPDEPDIGLSWP